EKEILKRRFAALLEASEPARRAVAARVERVNGTRGEPRSFDLLHALLEDQPYRLSFWRVAAEEINYRRFFDVNDLAAIRMENPAVFEAAHRLVFELVEAGEVTGLRIDHPDGLRDPSAYFDALEERAARLAVRAALGPGVDDRAVARALERLREEGAPARPLYVVVEKILARGEELPADWAVFGTSGYDFTTSVSALFVDASAESAMTEIYARFIGQRIDFFDLIYQKKKLILETSLAGELNVLADALSAIAERDRHFRDFTLGALTHALREVIACFPVYRTYVRERTEVIDARDRAAVILAIRLARRKNPTTDASIYEFVRAVLLGDLRDGAADEDRATWRDFVLRVQQLTGPVMAKGLEDTAFYVYNRLVALNEVGGEPERFGLDVGEFHRENAERQAAWPGALLATSTHDTKRSEDVRARIAALSEMTGEWADALVEMSRATNALRVDIEESLAPDRNEEYLFYQTVVGTWDDARVAGTENTAWTERLVAYMRKATKEAKVNTSWIHAHPGWDAAVEAFVRGALAPGSAFLDAVAPIARAAAYFGRWSALAQAVLKLTAPGVPDIYQGTETWDDSLVDPDNRRPVDFDARRRLLEEVRAGQARGRAFAEELVVAAEDGRIKLLVTRAALALRARVPAPFGAASTYRPLAPSGAAASHVIGFARRAPSGAEVAVVVPRLAAKLVQSARVPPIGEVWGETKVDLTPGDYVDAFTGERVTVGAGGALVRDVLVSFPAALLEKV
ncbi:MAG TPA: malto-oligosyltrehalose synthase, partial [Minicystis sp.]|nr:malto-oligosyltrehalose synthase [Minicystis sp.]